nr:hypothetical protein [Tanacetum cinerariifolium]
SFHNLFLDGLKWSPSQGNSRSNQRDPSMQVELRSKIRAM